MNAAAASRYRRVGLGLLLLAAAAPYRFYGSFPVVASISVLDGALLLAGCGMLAQRAMSGAADIGDRRLFGLLCVMPVLSVASTLWTTDLSATIREILSYGEALLAYVYAAQQTRGVPAEVIIRWLRRFTYVLLVPSVLMLLHVPGFQPQEPGLRKSSGDYISYFTRLSHPFIGRSNNLATVLIMVVIVLFYWGFSHHDRATSRAALLATIAIALTVSRGAIIALVLAGLAHLALPRNRPRRRANQRLIIAVLTGGMAITTAAWTFYVFNPDTRLFIASRLSTSNVVLRESRLSVGFARLAEHPLLGYGAGALPGNDLAILGGVHNTYLQQLLAYGAVLGLIAVLSLFEVVRRLLGRGSVGLRRAIGLTVLAQLIDFAVESSFEGAVLRVLIYLLLGMLVGLLRAAEDQPADAPTAQRPEPPAQPTRESPASVEPARG